MFAVACTRGGDAPAETADAPAAHEETAKPGANIVQVDPGMLRDLRITTQAVESRSGAEEVMLLGELAVDERAYAEVTAPVAARVTRLLANAGDTRRCRFTARPAVEP